MRHEEETGSGTQERRGKGRKKGGEERHKQEGERKSRKREEERKLVGSSTSEHSRERERERERKRGGDLHFWRCVAACSHRYNKPENRKRRKQGFCVCVSECRNQERLDVAARKPTCSAPPPSKRLKPQIHAHILKSKSKKHQKKHQNRKSKNRKPSVWFVVVCIFQAAPRHSDFRALVFCWYVHVSVSAYFRQPPITPTGRPLAKGNFPWPHRAG